MDLLSVGDQSGRPDTSGVDPDLAQDYARRMFEAVLWVKFDICKNLHAELNKDPPLYVVALDMYRAMCKQRGTSSGRWREYVSD